MQVQSIQQHTSYTNYSRQKTNFKGEFISNSCIKEIMQKANIDDLRGFEKILQDMKKFKDDLVIWVEKDSWSDPNICSYADYDLYKRKGQNTQTEQLFNTVDNFSDTESSILKHITIALENLYKENFYAQSQGAKVEEIEKLLIQ